MGGGRRGAGCVHPLDLMGMIDRHATLRKMSKARDVSQWATLGSMLVFVVVWMQTMTHRSDPLSLLLGAAIVGIVVRLLMSFAYCRRAVRCPNCRASLWSCAYHGFGRGAQTVMKPHAHGCPRCHLGFTTVAD